MSQVARLTPHRLFIKYIFNRITRRVRHSGALGTSQRFPPLLQKRLSYDYHIWVIEQAAICTHRRLSCAYSRLSCTHRGILSPVSSGHVLHKNGRRTVGNAVQPRDLCEPYKCSSITKCRSNGGLCREVLASGEKFRLSVDQTHRIGDFQVAFSRCSKASPSALSYGN